MRKLLARLSSFRQQRSQATTRPRGQSYVELALILPALLIILLGMVEVSIYVGRYLDLLDLTREAARFASVRDPFVNGNINTVSCSAQEPFHFYYHTSCIFSPPAGSEVCTANPSFYSRFCNGLNPYIIFNPETDDIVISVYTVTGINVSDVWPWPETPVNNSNGIENQGWWAFSDNDQDTAHNANWKYDCEGNEVRTTPYFDRARVQASLTANTLLENRGFVAVEFYYCYNQALNIPLISDFIPNPLRIHAYTLMPLPAAQPTATPNIP